MGEKPLRREYRLHCSDRVSRAVFSGWAFRVIYTYAGMSYCAEFLKCEVRSAGYSFPGGHHGGIDMGYFIDVCEG